jgi:hypothetical protein
MRIDADLFDRLQAVVAHGNPESALEDRLSVVVRELEDEKAETEAFLLAARAVVKESADHLTKVNRLLALARGDEKGKKRAKRQTIGAEALEKARAAVATNGVEEWTPTRLAEAMGASKDTARRALDALRGEETLRLVRPAEKGRGGSEAVYAVMEPVHA